MLCECMLFRLQNKIHDISDMHDDEKINIYIYMSLSAFRINPTTSWSSAMRCQSLSILGLEVGAGVSCILSSRVLSLDSSSSLSQRATSPSWKESTETIISNDKCALPLAAAAIYVKHFNLLFRLNPNRCFYLKLKSTAARLFG